MTASTTVTASCIDCGRPMLPQGTYDQLAKEQRAGLTRTGARGLCQPCYRRSRTAADKKPQGPLDDHTLATLRRAVGIPPEGPTPQLKKAWADEDRFLANDGVEPPPAADVDEQLAQPDGAP